MDQHCFRSTLQEFGGISGCQAMVSDVLSQLTSPLNLEDKRTMTCLG